MNDINHCITKALVESNPTGTMFVLEDLARINLSVVVADRLFDILVVTTCGVTFDIERHLFFFFKCSHKTIAFYFNLWYTNFVNGMKGVFDVREKKNNRARTFQLSPATLNDLDEYAATSLYPKSAIVEMALRKFFDDMKQKNTLTVESK